MGAEQPRECARQEGKGEKGAGLGLLRHSEHPFVRMCPSPGALGVLGEP